MNIIEFDIYQSAAIGVIVLCLGMFIIKKCPVLRKYCIPAAVAGGIVFAVLMAALHYSDVAEIHFDETLKNVFMMLFYSSIGFLASFKMLKQGGRLVLILLFLALALLCMQDVVGAALASAFGYDAKLGLCLGSVSLIGGHGTSASYGPLLEDDYGIAGATTVAVAAATFGLAISGFIGGPLARHRIRRHNLEPCEMDIELEADAVKAENIREGRFLHALVLMLLVVGAGTYICDAFKAIDVTVPVYFGAMIIGVVIRNIADHRHVKLPIREMSVLGNISLFVFLAMALMTMKLWQIADLADVMVITLAVQIVLVALFSYFVVFRCTGSDYESAALLTATCGFGLGATPNAMANMEALQEEHGPAPTAFFVVPLVGSVFIDLLNSGVLTVMINVL